MSEPILLSADKYWELRCKSSEHGALVERLKAEISQSKAAIDALATAAGLDCTKPYRLDDATLTATEVVNG